MVEWVPLPIPRCLCDVDACQMKRNDVGVLWARGKLMGLTMAPVAVKTDRLLRAEACTVGATIENEVFSAFETRSSG